MKYLAHLVFLLSIFAHAADSPAILGSKHFEGVGTISMFRSAVSEEDLRHINRTLISTGRSVTLTNMEKYGALLATPSGVITQLWVQYSQKMNFVIYPLDPDIDKMQYYNMHYDPAKGVFLVVFAHGRWVYVTYLKVPPYPGEPVLDSGITNRLVKQNISDRQWPIGREDRIESKDVQKVAILTGKDDIVLNFHLTNGSFITYRRNTNGWVLVR